MYGVPKGLISGRHLFLTFISGLLRAMKYSKVHHFADDASLNFSSFIILINKQVAYIAIGWNANENLAKVQSSSFEFQNV